MVHIEGRKGQSESGGIGGGNKRAVMKLWQCEQCLSVGAVGRQTSVWSGFRYLLATSSYLIPLTSEPRFPYW